MIVTSHCPMLDGCFIHPVRNQYVMAGHGTIVLEILDELPECDAIFGKFSKKTILVDMWRKDRTSTGVGLTL